MGAVGSMSQQLESGAGKGRLVDESSPAPSVGSSVMKQIRHKRLWRRGSLGSILEGTRGFVRFAGGGGWRVGGRRTEDKESLCRAFDTRAGPSFKTNAFWKRRRRVGFQSVCRILMKVSFAKGEEQVVVDMRRGRDVLGWSRGPGLRRGVPGVEQTLFL